jgi:hypothetical protein
MRDLTLTEIWIYPVKSLGGIQLQRAKVFEKGLQYDRRWMLVDANGVFMTQRVYPLMALFKQSIEDRTLTITKVNPLAGRKPSIMFDLNSSAKGKIFQSKVWDDNVEVIEPDPEISEWFTFQLGTTCRLAYFPEPNNRPVDVRYQVNKEEVGLADAYPFMIIGQASLDDLNSRMKESLPMNRFRPNFVFTGGDPFEEDGWRNLTIGKNRFVGVKNCSRCVLTTVNQDTAEKGIEPLLTLSAYRKRENKIYFGQNLVAVDHGHVSVGDKIIIE